MIRQKIYLFILFVCFVLPAVTHAQSTQPFDSGSYIAKNDTMPYRILFPLNFDPAKKYPLIFILHGAGERGNDNEAQLKYGPKLFLNDTIRSKYAAIIVYPQCPPGGFWSNVKMEDDSATRKTKFIFQVNAPPTRSMQTLMALVDEFLDKPYVDKHKVYVGGLSMGGMGTFEIIGRRPNIFAAAFAMCGGDNTLNAKKYAKKVPLWVFHGEKDSVVPYSHSESIVAAIKQEGGSPRYTLYTNDDHNCWDDAFAEPDFMPWLFSHSK
ncbi:carboxylesterase family protein [Mucilaginibacter gotjawali]|uniref:Peptidase n=2 Tax=Mucilaginibacter gotjawali TaxID=1550579 RepID=A0A839SFJ2_9SPHI|nr:prolyl oligopeptidase family serine peptidase [Mucilaginibacter gotjawali]MBB3055399.1 putative peptidase [Mucilaginibacter gotjawali]BAU53324.1 esterase [Mucilaginibacter gotjawali]